MGRGDKRSVQGENLRRVLGQSAARASQPQEQAAGPGNARSHSAGIAGEAQGVSMKHVPLVIDAFGQSAASA